MVVLLVAAIARVAIVRNHQNVGTFCRLWASYSDRNNGLW